MNKTVDDLCDDLKSVKAQISKLNKQKNEIELAIGEKIAHNTEGSKTEKFDRFKVTKKVVFNRTFSAKAFQAWHDAGGELDEKYHSLVEYKLKMNESVCKKIEQEDKELNKELSKFITMKQGKTSITISDIEE